jgi:hypothetical protein
MVMLLWTLWACSEGPAVETQLESLRLVAAVAEPAELGPAEPFELTLHTADPAGEGLDLLAWTCLPDGQGGCVETALGLPRQAHVAAVEGAGLEETVALLGNPAIAAGLEEADEVALPVWMLACAPGLCPALELALTDPAAGSADEAELMGLLADPTTWMAELPLEGVSLALRSLRTTERPAEQRHRNPQISELELPEGIDEGLKSGADHRFLFGVELATEIKASAYGLSTLGGFTAPGYAVSEGQTEPIFTSLAEDEGEADVILVVQDDLGGVAVWRRPILLQR